jgi:hypothetical protein
MEWLKFIGIVAAGVFVFSLIMWCLMASRWLKPEKVLEEVLKRRGAALGDDWKKQREQEERKEQREKSLGSGLQIPVGALEIALYATSIAYGEPGFIAVWFATKYVASWRGWTSDPVGRTFYNRSLFGSGLNIVFGVITGWVALALTKPPFPGP